MSIPLDPVSVTLYNFRKHCTTESDFAATLEKLCTIGYRTVQVSGVPLEPQVIRKQLDSFGLHCCATHESIDTIKGPSEPLIEKMQILNCDFTASGSPGKIDFTSPEVTSELADAFNRQGEALAAAGIKLGYHNHAFEFTKLNGSDKIMLEKFLELTAGHNVYAELDVHWVARGGGSPASWIKKLENRISVIHLKDFTIVQNEPVFCEIGMGNLDWDAILNACKATGVRWYTIEQDKEFPGRDIFESAKISFDNLSAMVKKLNN